MAQVFAETCAACHGAKLQGGQAASLARRRLDARGRRREPRPVDPRGPARRRHAGLRQRPLRAGDPRARDLHPREGRRGEARAETVFAKPSGDTVVKSEEHAFRVETVAEGLETPWSIAFLPDGRMLVTEKAGRLRIVEKGKLLPEAVAGVPPVWSQGQGGLLDVAVHPDYAKNGWIYLSFSDPGADGTAMTKVVRGRLRGRTARRPGDPLRGPEGALPARGRSTSARASSSTGRATSSSRSASGARRTTRRTSRARTARCTASTTTAASPRTTRSRSRRGPCRRSGATATATRRASRSTP